MTVRRVRGLIVLAGIVILAATGRLFGGDDEPQAYDAGPVVTEDAPAAPADPEPPQRQDEPQADDDLGAEIGVAHEVATEFVRAYLTRGAQESQVDRTRRAQQWTTDEFAAELERARDAGTAEDAGWQQTVEVLGVQTQSSRRHRIEVVVMVELDTDQGTVPTNLGVGLVREGDGPWLVNDVT